MLLFAAILLSLTSFGVRAQDDLAEPWPETTAGETVPQEAPGGTEPETTPTEETLPETSPETSSPQDTTISTTEQASTVPTEPTLPDIQETATATPEEPSEDWVERGPSQEQPVLPPLPESQRLFPGKNYTNAAPFLAPVAGTAPLARNAKAQNSEDSGLELAKTAKVLEDGTVEISLEAYVTGEAISSIIRSDVPTDIILVLDQSGSMGNPFGYQFNAYSPTTNTNYYNYYNRNNLWTQLDGSYIQVSLERETIYDYTALINWSNSSLWNIKDNLYILQNGSYQKVRVTRTNANGTYSYYVDSTNALIETSTGRNTFPQNTYYRPSWTQAGYRYTYRYTLNGETIILRVNEVRTGENDAAGIQLYHRETSSTTRLEALTTAVTSFAEAVANKAKGADGTAGTDDDISHRIAMVGFASGGIHDRYDYHYTNSEVFVGSQGYTYGTSAQGQYSNALQDMRTQAGIANIAASIGALDADGGTLTHLGLEMANGILAANPVSAGEKRNRVVIVFTDGAPGWSGYEADYANSAIGEANVTKSTYQATVYGVGIFDGADATSAGNQNGTQVEKCNWFMQNLSSNNGAVQDPSYYLSAQDAKALQNIFEQISEQIEEGGAKVKLDESTVLKDVISPYFELPEGGAQNIQLFTSAYLAEDTWAEPVPFSDGSVTIEDKTLSVTGFDYAENWVGTETNTDTGLVTYRGQKLIVKLLIQPEAGFFGGQDVPTNDGSSGIYQEGELFEPFPLPHVDIPLVYETAAQNQSVYLTQPADLSQLLAFAAGYQPDGDNNRFVTIEYALMKGDQTVGTYTISPGATEGSWIWQVDEGRPVLFEDTAYRLACHVTSGLLTKDVTPKEATVFVLHPEVTWQDQTIYLGETPDYGKDLGSLRWTGSLGAGVPAGPIPTLSYTYAPEAAAFLVDTTVSVHAWIGNTDITQWTTFLWSPSSDCVCTQKPEEGAFRVHVKSCSLTITKSGAFPIDDPQSFLFQLCGTSESNQNICLKVAVVGDGSVTITGLPIGSYTLMESTDWSWRYTTEPSWSTSLSREQPEASIQAVNTRTNTHWLDGCAVANNVFEFLHGGGASQ